MTFPAALADLPPFEDYCMRGRTYRYATKKPMFPFGFGLSYTSFAYSNLECRISRNALRIAFTLKNTGDCAGADVAQVYWRHGRGGYPVPRCELAAFKRINLKPGAQKRVTMVIPLKQFVHYDKTGAQKSLAGRDIELFIGGNASLNAPLHTSIKLTRN